MSIHRRPSHPFFFFNDTATTEIYPLSLHDALPIFTERSPMTAMATASAALLNPIGQVHTGATYRKFRAFKGEQLVDRKSTRLNSSHLVISYAVFCLKKKKHRVKQ